MKTTVEISDPLLESAKRHARARGTTLRALIEEGLRILLAEAVSEQGAFVLRDASVTGNGLQPDVRAGAWDRMIALAYEGRGS
ncbi:MAG: DUF2191 domain-containing protein [Gemmatimonadota bacterium]